MKEIPKEKQLKYIAEKMLDHLKREQIDEIVEDLENHIDFLRFQIDYSNYEKLEALLESSC